MGNEGSGPGSRDGDVGSVCGHLLIAPDGAGADPPLRIAMRIVRQVFRLRGHPIVPTFPQPTLARGRSGLSWEIVTRYGGATALDLFAEANARGSLFFPPADRFRRKDT